jgi:1,2-phenylacetyl-CoA epoxidase PaaB subunit
MKEKQLFELFGKKKRKNEYRTFGAVAAAVVRRGRRGDALSDRILVF